MTDDTRKVASCMLSTDDYELMAVVLELTDGFYLCKVRGDHAMVDIGPYRDRPTAEAFARLLCDKDVASMSMRDVELNRDADGVLVGDTTAYMRYNIDMAAELLRLEFRSARQFREHMIVLIDDVSYLNPLFRID